jgi:hypothetical protein
MKIGTITFHCSNNFGAVLQALALIKTLNNLGHEAKIIDYRPKYKIDEYKPMKIIKKYKSFKHFLYNLFSIPLKYKTDKNFKKFNSRFISTWGKTYVTYDEIINNPPDLDVIITGSDQVWNSESLDVLDKVYYLNFGADGIRRISYAPSFGTAKVDERFTNEISTYIKNLDAVSIRELEGKEQIKEITGIEAEHVLDPVFLLDKNQWLEVADDEIKIVEPYLLLYARERNKLLGDLAIKIAKEKNLKTVNISEIMLGLNNYHRNIFGIGPGHFLYLLKNASVVCTNSFHGTAFSIIFEKPFIAVSHRTRNTRIDSILNTLDLSSQLITNQCQFNYASADDLVNYDLKKTNVLLNNEREKSIRFLFNALDDSYDEKL